MTRQNLTGTRLRTEVGDAGIFFLFLRAVAWKVECREVIHDAYRTQFSHCFFVPILSRGLVRRSPFFSEISRKSFGPGVEVGSILHLSRNIRECAFQKYAARSSGLPSICMTHATIRWVRKYVSGNFCSARGSQATYAMRFQHPHAPSASFFRCGVFVRMRGARERSVFHRKLCRPERRSDDDFQTH